MGNWVTPDLLSQWWLPLALLGVAALMSACRAWLTDRSKRQAPPPLRVADAAPTIPPATSLPSPAPEVPANGSVLSDPLTGLMSRLTLEDRLSAASNRAELRGRQLALLCIDIDGFRRIVSHHGQAVGDAVLREVARRLQGMGRTTDALARLAGDQFLMLLDGDPDASAAALVADRVRQAVRRPFLVADAELQLSCSIGIVMHPEHGPKAKLLAHADTALLSAKRAGGNVHCFFEQNLQVDPDTEAELHAQLRQALKSSHPGLVLHYQPKVTAQGGHLTGVEALLRWQHPLRGLLRPKEFMSLAERYGLLTQLSQWVLQEACRQLRAWHDQGLHISMAVNLSRQQMRQADLLVQLQDALQSHQLSAEHLIIEVTEGDAMADPRLTTRVFERLHALGVTLSIDDFGSAQGSVPQLRYLPVVEVKIDQRHVQDAEVDSDAQAIVKGLVQLAHALDLRVVAEGVETEAQQDLMRRLGCDELQGYRLAAPMGPEALPSWHSSQGLAT